MVPDDEELFEALEQKIYEKMEDFTAPNFMGIIRVYNKMASKHHTLLSKVCCWRFWEDGFCLENK